MAGCKNDGFFYFHYELFKDIGKKKNNYGLTIEKKRRQAKSASFRKERRYGIDVYRAAHLQLKHKKRTLNFQSKHKKKILNFQSEHNKRALKCQLFRY